MSNPGRAERYAKWKLLIAEQKECGKSQKAFCVQRGISPAKLTYYRSVLSAQEKTLSQDNKKLVPIKLQSSTPAPVAHQIKITLPNGFRCEIPVSVSALHIKLLMGALLSC
jgi:hypothetical protein